MIKYKIGICDIYYNEENGEYLFLNSRNDVDISEITTPFKKIDILASSYHYDCVNISINITKQCNFRCKYCFNTNKRNEKPSFETIIKFIDKIINDTPYAYKYQIDLSGSGEPLLEIDTILKIADYCEDKSNEIRKEIIVMFVCNGSLLTKENVIALQNHSILFGVSIDGIKKSHDKNRVLANGKPTFNLIMKNVKQIAHKEFLGCAITISNNDIDILKSCLFFKKYFNTISIKIARGPKIDYQRIIEEYNKLFDYIMSSLNKGDVSLLMRLLNGDDMFGRFISTILLRSSYAHRCDAGIGKFALDADGKVYVCSAATGIKELSIGNVEEIDYQFARKMVTKIQCNNCEIKYFCGNECLVRYVESGIDQGMCKLKKHMFKMSLVLAATLEFTYPILNEKIISFLMESLERFSINESFRKLVELENDISFLELKNIYYADKEKYISLLKKHNISK